MLIIIALLLGGATLVELRRAREVLQLRQVDLAGLQALKRKLDVTEETNERLGRRIAPFRTAVANADILRLALETVSAAKHPDDWVSLLADANAYFETSSADALAPEGALGREQGAGVQSVIIEGYTPVSDLSTVGQMIERLREQVGVLDADLLGDERLREDAARDKRWADTGCSLFVIEMTMEVP
jgi:hypothetical protein